MSELPLEQTQADAAFGQRLLPDRALRVEDRHAGGRHLAAEAFQFALPGQAGRHRGVVRAFELLVELPDLLLGLGQRAAVFLDELVSAEAAASPLLIFCRSA